MKITWVALTSGRRFAWQYNGPKQELDDPIGTQEACRRRSFTVGSRAQVYVGLTIHALSNPLAAKLLRHVLAHDLPIQASGETSTYDPNVVVLPERDDERLFVVDGMTWGVRRTPRVTGVVDPRQFVVAAIEHFLREATS